MRSPFVRLLSIFALVASCASSAARSRRSGDLLRDASFARSEEILSGFDDFDSSAPWRVGDKVLFGLRLETGGEPRDLLILVEAESGAVPPHTLVPVTSVSGDSSLRADLWSPDWSKVLVIAPPSGARVDASSDSDSVLVLVRVFDGDGKTTDSRVFAPASYLHRGLFAACEGIFPHRDELVPNEDGSLIDVESSRPHLASVIQIARAMFGFYSLVQNTPNLAPLLEQVIAKPSILSVVFHRGIKLSIEPQFHELDADEREFPGLPRVAAFRIPLHLQVNGSVAVRCNWIVVPPDPPLRLCAGVIGVEGEHPEDPSHRFALRVLAARRGAK